MKNSFTVFLFLLLVSYCFATQSPHGNLDLECLVCHTNDSWEGMKFNPEFNHSKDTNFELEGTHKAADCLSCHKDLNFSNVQDNCLSCHTDIHNSAFGSDCSECHTQTQWKFSNSLNFHREKTNFPLTGAHNTLDCQVCHQLSNRGVFVGESNDCESCHLDDFNQTTNPPHQISGISTNCANCHTSDTKSWGKGFSHNQFPLTQVHNVQNCFKCHLDESFQNTQNDCIFCHQSDFQTAQNPKHLEAYFSVNCQNCHNTSNFDWKPANTFVHSTFDLVGAHKFTDCNSCHIRNQNVIYEGTPTDCFSCHESDFVNAENPSHEDFPQDCLQCHSQVSWEGANFDHSSYPLLGAHEKTDCNSCHSNGIFAGTPTDCISCHLQEFKTAQQPSHENFDVTCQNCHDFNGWKPASNFDHSFYSLTVGHDLEDCASCHSNGVFEGTSTDCQSCHLDDYNQTTNPPHQPSGLVAENCENCHSPQSINAWGSGFTHNQFSLVNVHDVQNCFDCHLSESFGELQSNCNFCHQMDYQNAQNPNHIQANFEVTCENCHTTIHQDWKPAPWFNHNNFFALVGAHASEDCNACHGNGTFVGTPNDCYTCHLQDFNSANNPPHTGYPQDCTICHSQNAWEPAGFPNHDNEYFPIFYGEHDDEWGNDCSTCHINPNNYSEFSCLNGACHPQAEMDDEHDEVSGYVYQSSACYNCHPDGEDDSPNWRKIRNRFER